MKIGIMQPYFVPYIGYWQLMNAVDKYVVYDDVNFIKGGWINRNRILINGKPQYINIPMIGASPFKHINEVGIDKNPRIMDKNLRTLEMAYRRAPYYEQVYPLMKRIMSCTAENLAQFVFESFQVINQYLNINTEMVMSSVLKKDCPLKGQDKVLAICKLLQATEYYNAIGGQELYSYDAFGQQGIKLNFLKTNSNIIYKQFEYGFQPNLSIVDVMMFNSREQVQKMLGEYELISEQTRENK